MAMRMTMAEFASDETLQETSPDVMASKMTLDFQADAYMRMKELGIKQKDLADILNVSPAAVSKMFSCDQNLRVSTMAKIAAALDCQIASPKLVPNDVEHESSANSVRVYA